MADSVAAGIKNDARSGGFNPDSSKGVYFNPDAATTMASQCANMLTYVNAALNFVKSTTNLEPLNQRDSGRELAGKYNSAAQRLVETVLTEHQTVLTDLGQAFVAAGASYTGMDSAAADAFKSGKGTDQQLSAAFNGFVGAAGNPTVSFEQVELPGWKQSGRGDEYGWSGTSRTDYDNLLTKTSQLTELGKAREEGVERDPVNKVNPEPGIQYHWDDFYNHWKYINEQSATLNQLSTFAQAWLTAKRCLVTGVDEFRSGAQKYLMPGYQGNTSLLEEVWASPASAQAKLTIEKYLTCATALANTMDLMSDNYAFTHGWLKRLQNFLPDKSISSYKAEFTGRSKLSEHTINEYMKVLRQAWDNWYVVGANESSKNIPLIPDLKSMEVKVPAVDNPLTNNGNPSTQAPNLTTGQPNLTNPVTDQPVTDQPVTNQPVTNQPVTDDTTQELLKTLLDQGSTLLESGVEAVQQAVEQIGTVISEGLTQLTDQTLDDVVDTTNEDVQPTDQVPVTNLAGLTGGGGGGGGGTGAGGGTSLQVPKTQLFPRAAAVTADSTDNTTTTTSSTSRAGLASTSGYGSGTSSPMMGSPMSGASQGGQQKEHKRADYLNSGEHLDTALGDTPTAVNAVAEK
ncbi:hypothetical protein JK358_12350 [Nocardia sp. 2]|uniref:ESX-1 secretion-associated protein EspA/EspE-like domain-containing protein n=1 Tax=Nocardia acididurans TaxID=2802282 RepID=A0ABS1M3D9_9NOCA|nr:hypothetical protein [Nocardia acididurans]MBL1075183.1 hypothetical protein [Nocardia acididurans]